MCQEFCHRQTQLSGGSSILLAPLYLYLSIYLSIYQPINQSIYLPICLSICHYLSIYLSYLPIFHHQMDSNDCHQIPFDFVRFEASSRLLYRQCMQDVKLTEDWHTSSKIITRGSAAVAPWARKFVMPSSRNRGLTCASGTGSFTYSTYQVAHATISHKRCMSCSVLSKLAVEHSSIIFCQSILFRWLDTVFAVVPTRGNGKNGNKVSRW